MQCSFDLGGVSLFFERFHKVLRHIDILKHPLQVAGELGPAFYVNFATRDPPFLSLDSILRSASVLALLARSNRFAKSFL